MLLLTEKVSRHGHSGLIWISESWFCLSQRLFKVFIRARTTGNSDISLLERSKVSRLWRFDRDSGNTPMLLPCNRRDRNPIISHRHWGKFSNLLSSNHKISRDWSLPNSPGNVSKSLKPRFISSIGLYEQKEKKIVNSNDIYN